MPVRKFDFVDQTYIYAYLHLPPSGIQDWLDKERKTRGLDPVEFTPNDKANFVRRNTPERIRSDIPELEVRQRLYELKLLFEAVKEAIRRIGEHVEDGEWEKNDLRDLTGLSKEHRLILKDMGELEKKLGTIEKPKEEKDYSKQLPPGVLPFEKSGTDGDK